MNRLDVSAFKNIITRGLHNDDEGGGEKSEKNCDIASTWKKRFFHDGERRWNFVFFHLRRRGTCTGKYVPTLNRPEKNSAVSIKPCSHDSTIKNRRSARCTHWGWDEGEKKRTIRPSLRPASLWWCEKRFFSRKEKCGTFFRLGRRCTSTRNTPDF